MSSSPSHIPRESVDIARTLREVTLHIFRASDDPGLSARFAEGHKSVLRAAGIRNLTSFGQDWLDDPDTTLFLLTCQDDEVLLSGMRLQRRTAPGTLPLEKAVGGLSPDLMRYLDERQAEGCGEFCALWSRRETAVAGIGMLPMACVGLGLMPQLDIRHGFAFMGTNMRPIQRELGFTILEHLGEDGQFAYPAPPIRSEIGHFLHPESLADAAEDVQEMARRAAEEPNHVHGIDGRFHRIHYRVENHMA
ncbi:MAG: hypothetical protein ACPF8Y_01445 [Flavobacteriales bacterium]